MHFYTIAAIEANKCSQESTDSSAATTLTPCSSSGDKPTFKAYNKVPTLKKPLPKNTRSRRPTALIKEIQTVIPFAVMCQRDDSYDKHMKKKKRKRVDIV